ncbi:Alpha-galactosidase 6 [Verticillium dahliae VDG1]|nr:Alpha-galactosidase 6 [Verticillium dahliae VDG1]
MPGKKSHPSQNAPSGQKPSWTKKKLSKTTKPKKASVETPEEEPATPELPLVLQQRILDIFRNTFADLFVAAATEEDRDAFVLTPLLQEIKAALFARDFDAAFSNARPALLDAYAARWSPTRALAYAAALTGLTEHLEALMLPVEEASTEDAEVSGAPEGPKKNLRVVSFGGGAAEIAAFAAYLHLVNAPKTPEDNGEPLTGTIDLVDSAPWGPVATNAALVDPGLLSSAFTHDNALTMSRNQLAGRLGTANGDGTPLLVTLLFTLNELYTTGGIGKTTAFLMNLTATVPEGSLLLVLDSPGSYSEAAVGKESKKYPMHWLMDHCLLKPEQRESAQSTGGRYWEKIDSQDSVWFRLSESVTYPIPLENMRYQLHLYRAIRS